MAEENNVEMNSVNKEMLLRSSAHEREIPACEQESETRRREQRRLTRRERDKRYARHTQHRHRRDDDSRRNKDHSSTRTHGSNRRPVSSTQSRTSSGTARDRIQPAKRKSKYNYDSSSYMDNLLTVLSLPSRVLLQMWKTRTYKETMYKCNKKKTRKTCYSVYL